jgi:hypothetical protein
MENGMHHDPTGTETGKPETHRCPVLDPSTDEFNEHYYEILTDAPGRPPIYRSALLRGPISLPLEFTPASRA